MARLLPGSASCELDLAKLGLPRSGPSCHARKGENLSSVKPCSELLCALGHGRPIVPAGSICVAVEERGLNPAWASVQRGKPRAVGQESEAWRSRLCSSVGPSTYGAGCQELRPRRDFGLVA